MKRASRRQMKWAFVGVVVLGCVASGTAQAAVRHVPSQYGTIQAAIDAANDYDEVVIEPNTYTGIGNRDLTFGGKVITVRGQDPSDPNVVGATIIDCQGSSSDYHQGFIFDSNDVDPNAVVAGLTITNGYASYGGGIYCPGGSPTITHCTICQNTASYSGGGIHCSRGGSPTITHCTITQNTASVHGGGIFSWEASPTITNCTISQNTAWSRGGGIWGGSGTSTITNCTICDNMASEGGALDCSEDSSATLSNCILWGNTATLAGPQICLKGCPQGTSTVDVSYSDVQGGPNEVSIESGCGACAVNWGAGNIDADPLCVDPNGPDGDPNTWEDNDYHLSPSSPCIGAGDPNGDYTGQTDIDGQPRLMGPVVDMGSDEVPLTLTVTNGTGSGTYIQDQVVAISTTVPAGTRFGQWTGDTDNVTDIYSASTTVVMKDNTTLTATFVTQYALTVHNGTGDGTYDVGLDVPIQATVPPGMAFDQWTGDVANVADVNAASTTVTMNADTTVTATFVALCTLTVTVTGQGSVTPNGGTYPAGTPVTLTATAADGWQFVNWENGATGSDLSVTVTMDTDKTVEAVFGEIGVVPQPPPLPCAAGAAPGQLAFWWCVCAIGLAAMRWRHRR